jgi:hypothetical protein
MQTIGVGCRGGVRRHLGRGHRGGRGLMQGSQWRVEGDAMRSSVGRWHRVRRIHEDVLGGGGGGASRRSSAPSGLVRVCGVGCVAAW